MSDIEKLIGNTMPFVEEQHNKHGVFFPLATTVTIKDSIEAINYYEENENPLPEKLINDLKSTLKASKENYKTFAIFYDVKVTDPTTNLKTDAVAVFIESKNDLAAYTFYYPYIYTKDKKVVFSDSWKNEKLKEIFQYKSN